MVLPVEGFDAATTQATPLGLGSPGHGAKRELLKAPGE